MTTPLHPEEPEAQSQSAEGISPQEGVETRAVNMRENVKTELGKLLEPHQTDALLAWADRDPEDGSRLERIHETFSEMNASAILSSLAGMVDRPSHVSAGVTSDVPDNPEAEATTPDTEAEANPDAADNLGTTGNTTVSSVSLADMLPSTSADVPPSFLADTLPGGPEASSSSGHAPQDDDLQAGVRPDIQGNIGAADNPMTTGSSSGISPGNPTTAPSGNPNATGNSTNNPTGAPPGNPTNAPSGNPRAPGANTGTILPATQTPRAPITVSYNTFLEAHPVAKGLDRTVRLGLGGYAGIVVAKTLLNNYFARWLSFTVGRSLPSLVTTAPIPLAAPLTAWGLRQGVAKVVHGKATREYYEHAMRSSASAADADSVLRDMNAHLRTNAQRSVTTDDLINEPDEDQLIVAFSQALPHSVVHIPSLGTTERYAQHCFAQFCDITRRAAAERSGTVNGPRLPNSLSPIQRTILADYDISNVSDPEIATKRRKLLEISIAYGKLVEKEHGKKGRYVETAATLATAIATGSWWAYGIAMLWGGYKFLPFEAQARMTFDKEGIIRDAKGGEVKSKGEFYAVGAPMFYNRAALANTAALDERAKAVYEQIITRFPNELLARKFTSLEEFAIECARAMQTTVQDTRVPPSSGTAATVTRLTEDRKKLQETLAEQRKRQTELTQQIRHAEDDRLPEEEHADRTGLARLRGTRTRYPGLIPAAEEERIRLETDLETATTAGDTAAIDVATRALDAIRGSLGELTAEAQRLDLEWPNLDPLSDNAEIVQRRLTEIRGGTIRIGGAIRRQARTVAQKESDLNAAREALKSENIKKAAKQSVPEKGKKRDAAYQRIEADRKLDLERAQAELRRAEQQLEQFEQSALVMESDLVGKLRGYNDTIRKSRVALEALEGTGGQPGEIAATEAAIQRLTADIASRADTVEAQNEVRVLALAAAIRAHFEHVEKKNGVGGKVMGAVSGSDIAMKLAKAGGSIIGGSAIGSGLTYGAAKFLIPYLVPPVGAFTGSALLAPILTIAGFIYGGKFGWGFYKNFVAKK